jgi:two-component system NtrC family sensor kinase
MKHFLAVSFTVLFCIAALMGYAQANIVDSLKKVLLSQEEDSFKVKTLNALTYSLNTSAEYVEAFEYGEQAVELAKKIKFHYGVAKSYQLIASAYQNQTNNAEAVKYYHMALDEYLVAGNHTNIGRCYINLGLTYQALRNYQEAIKYCYLALKHFETSDDKQWKGESYLLLSSLYNDQGNDTAALKNSLLGLRLKQENGDKYGIAAAYGQVAYIHLTYGRFRESLQNQLKALQIFKEKNNPQDAYSIGWTQHNIGFLYGKFAVQSASQGNAIEAKQYFAVAVSNCLDALKVYNRFQSTTDIAAVCGDLGSIYTNMGMFDSANTYLQRALKVSIASRNNFPLRETYKYLLELDSARGDFKSAFFNQKLYYVYRDSMANSENIDKLTQERVQFEYDKKETLGKAMQEGKDAEARRIRNLQYTAIAIFLLLTVFLFFNNRQKQKAKTKIENAYSELRSAQSQLIQSEKMASLGQLTAGIAHEIQNPLNFVNNFSDVNTELIEEVSQEMRKGNISEAEIILNDIKENEQKINHHGKRADSIVKNMLQHSRSSTGIKEPTDINALADEYLRLAYHGMRGKDKSFNVALQTDFDSNIGKINVIPQDVGRVLLNLYNNAFYAVNEKKKIQVDEYDPFISVTTKKNGDKVAIKVVDNGIGIPQKVIDKIFQPFFTTKPTGEGTGLGLSLSYDIIKANNGQITLTSEEGAGSDFTVVLPAIAQ